jgi:voltage-gated potassium channel
MGAIVGKISSVFVTKSLLQRNKMKKYKHFVVVCNWNTKAPGIVSELLQADEALNVVVVHTGAVNLHTDFKEEERDRLSFHQADPMNYEVLRGIRIPDAKSVILLADASVENPDDKNALIALAIKHLEKETTDVHVVVELIHTNRRKHLLDAGADEVICSTDYTAGIIAQSAIYNRMSEVYERLLSYSANTNEIYFVSKYPSSFIGKPFLDLIPEVSQRSDEQKSPVLLIGIKRKEKIFLNPKSERVSVLEKNDELIVMSYDRVEQIV